MFYAYFSFLPFSSHQMFTDEQFELIRPFFPKPCKPEKIPLRRCVDAICYVLKEGRSWRWLHMSFMKKSQISILSILAIRDWVNLVYLERFSWN